jgi:cephalosporin-C deacetylase-like acetyl esterase
MCPFCFASMALVATGATSGGGLAALAVKLSRKASRAAEIVPNSNSNANSKERSTRDVYERDSKIEGSLAG